MLVRSPLATYPLPELMSHLSLARATGTLTVLRDGDLARVSFVGGRVHCAPGGGNNQAKGWGGNGGGGSQSAELNGLWGLERAFRWREGEVEFRTRAAGSLRGDPGGHEVPELLRLLVWRRPELAAAIWPLPPPDAPLEPAKGRSERSRSRLTPGQRRLLERLVEGCTLTDLTGQSLADALSNVRNLRALIAAGFVSYPGRDECGTRLLRLGLRAFLRESRCRWIAAASADGRLLAADGRPPDSGVVDIAALAAGAASVCGSMSGLMGQHGETRLSCAGARSAMVVHREDEALLLVWCTPRTPLGVARLGVRDLMALCGGCLRSMGAQGAWTREPSGRTCGAGPATQKIAG